MITWHTKHMQHYGMVKEVIITQSRMVLSQNPTAMTVHTSCGMPRKAEAFQKGNSVFFYLVLCHHAFQPSSAPSESAKQLFSACKL